MGTGLQRCVQTEGQYKIFYILVLVLRTKLISILSAHYTIDCCTYLQSSSILDTSTTINLTPRFHIPPHLIRCAEHIDSVSIAPLFVLHVQIQIHVSVAPFFILHVYKSKYSYFNFSFFSFFHCHEFASATAIRLSQSLQLYLLNSVQGLPSKQEQPSTYPTLLP